MRANELNSGGIAIVTVRSMLKRPTQEEDPNKRTKQKTEQENFVLSCNTPFVMGEAPNVQSTRKHVIISRWKNRVSKVTTTNQSQPRVEKVGLIMPPKP